MVLLKIGPQWKEFGTIHSIRIYALIRSALEPEEQKVIWLRCFDRMPVEEITRVLGIESASGARSVLQRARRKLRAALMESDE